MNNKGFKPLRATKKASKLEAFFISSASVFYLGFMIRLGLSVGLILVISTNCFSQNWFADLAFQSFNKGNLQEAQRLFDWAIAADSLNAELWSNRAHIKRRRRNINGAYADFKKATEIEPNSVENQFYFAITAHQTGKYEEAINANSKVIELGNSKGSQTFLNRAASFIQLGKNDKALADFENAIKLKDENLKQAYFDRGQFYLRINDKKQALADFKNVIELNPENVQLCWDVGALAYELEKYTDALTYYSKAIDQLDKPQSQALLVRGEVFEKLENYQAAIQDYSRVIDMQENLVNAYYLRGQAKARLGKTEEACSDWKKAAELGNREAKDVVVYNCE